MASLSLNRQFFHGDGAFEASCASGSHLDTPLCLIDGNSTQPSWIDGISMFPFDSFHHFVSKIWHRVRLF